MEQRNHVLDGGPGTPFERAILDDMGARSKEFGLSVINYEKQAKPVDAVFGLWTLETRAAQGQLHSLGGRHCA